MEKEKHNLGLDINPETGNLLTKEQEKNTCLPFRPFEEDWMDKAENKPVLDSMVEEYKQSPTEIKFLAGVCDGTVLGVYERLWTESKGGEEFYTLTELQNDITISGNQQVDTDNHTQIFDIDRYFNGYHSMGNMSQAMRKIQELKSKLDVGSESVKNLSIEKLNELVDNDGFFSVDDVEGISRFATALVVFIKDESWKKFDKEEEVSEDMTHGAFYSTKNAIIYAPANFEQQSDPIGTLKHEYSHMVDYMLQKNSRLDENKLYIETSDGVLRNLKSEIAAYLTSNEMTNPYGLLDEIQSHLREGYNYLYGKTEDAEKCDNFFQLIKNTEPFLNALIEEAGFDSDDNKIKNLFLRTFLTALPERPIIFKMLEKIPDTVLYKAGLN